MALEEPTASSSLLGLYIRLTFSCWVTLLVMFDAGCHFSSQLLWHTIVFLYRHIFCVFKTPGVPSEYPTQILAFPWLCNAARLREGTDSEIKLPSAWDCCPPGRSAKEPGCKL